MQMSEELLLALGALDDDAARVSFLEQHPGLASAESASKLTLEVYQKVKDDPQQALRLAIAAVTIARGLSDRRPLAESLRAKGNALFSLNENRSAVEHHDQALALFEREEDSTQIARTLSASIQPLILLGEYQRAFAASARAREIFLATGNRWRLSRMEVNEGNIYFRLDRFAEALACYQRAYEELVSHQDGEAAAAALSNMASTLISLGDYPRALATYEQARELCERQGMPLLVALADYNIAYLHFFRGEYSRAIELLRGSRQAAEALGDAYQHALCQMDLAEIYIELNLGEEAVEMAGEAQMRFERLGLQYEAAKSLAFLAIAEGQRGKAFHALELLARARGAFAAEGNRVWPALLDLYQALLLYNERRFFEARRLCTASLEFWKSSLEPNKAVLCHLLLARLHVATAEPELARQECGIALERLRALDSPALILQANLLHGQIQLAEGERQASYDSFQAARRALETLRSNLRGEELKIGFVKNRLEVYEHLVELCLMRDDENASREEAFAYMEEAKSRSLIDLIFRPVQGFSAPDGGQSEAVRHIRSLREELNWYYRLIEREQLQPEERSPARIATLELEADARERALLRRLRELPESEAEYASLHTPSTAPVERIREALPPGAVLLEYFRVRDRILAAVLTRDSLDISPVTLVSRVTERLRLLRFQLSKFRLGEEYVRSFREPLLEATNAHLRELYDELIAPIRERVEGRHLIFVPHDVLHAVPLHALYDGERHLIDLFTISYAPSATLYVLCHGKQANAGGGTLVLGVPDARAPRIQEEVQAVASVLPGADLYLGDAASQDVLRSKGPTTRLLHVATHGQFRGDSPMFSGIRLGDAYLSLYDLYSLRLPAELVTLSGCATGASVVSAGDEVRGLVRGLLYAGVQSMLLTLWDVHDRSTAEFMERFYRRFVQHGDKASALQEAMLGLRDRYPHPYYWAPFALTGKVFSS